MGEAGGELIASTVSRVAEQHAFEGASFDISGRRFPPKKQTIIAKQSKQTIPSKASKQSKASIEIPRPPPRTKNP